MADPLSVPVLTGAALTQAFGFLYGRLAALLDRRSAEKQAHALAGEPAEILCGEIPAGVPDRAVLEQNRDRLELLADALESYLSEPEVLAGSDGALRSLGRLRAILEEIYGEHITFVGEERPVSGLKISQRIENVEGEVLGLDADHRAPSGEIDQNVRHVREGGTVIGARIGRVE